MTKEEAWRRTKGYLYDALDGDEACEIIEALEQSLCEDCISREKVVTEINKYKYYMTSGVTHQCIWNECVDVIAETIQELPPVTLQEPKAGHWIEHPHEAGSCWEYSKYECSECNRWSNDDSDFCPNCGAKMGENEEWEEWI